MKTIQEVIRELDPHDIEMAYFFEYPIELWKIRNHSDLAIDEYRRQASARFQQFLQYLKDLELGPNEKEQGILFVSKVFDNGFAGKLDVNLIYQDELLKAHELSEVKTYAYNLEDREKALSYFVADNKLTQDNLMNLVVTFLFEISFFGYDEKDVQKARDDLDRSIREVEEHPEQLKEWDTEECRKKFDLPEKEEYPREEEFREKHAEISYQYATYCRCIELERIKNGFDDV